MQGVTCKLSVLAWHRKSWFVNVTGGYPNSLVRFFYFFTLIQANRQPGYETQTQNLINNLTI